MKLTVLLFFGSVVVAAAQSQQAVERSFESVPAGATDLVPRAHEPPSAGPNAHSVEQTTTVSFESPLTFTKTLSLPEQPSNLKSPTMEFSFQSSGVPHAGNWREPRNFHTPFDPAFHNRVLIVKTKPAAQTNAATLSSNKAYRFTLSTSDSQSTEIALSAGDSGYRITIKEPYPNFPVEARWVNEKLLFFRAYWGRVIGSDYIFDVEHGQIIHQEMVHDGTLLFHQTTESKGTLGEQPPADQIRDN